MTGSHPAPAALLVLSLLWLPHLPAQEPSGASFRGEVVKDGTPVPEGTVVLHRVTREDAGEVDSVRLGRDGRFEFRLPEPPDPEVRSDVYFASIRHQGIFYFGAALTRPAQLDSLYRIEVHDTVVAPAGGAELPVSHRTVVLEEGDGDWQVTDLFELRNERGRTVVAPDGGVTWSYPLPAEAGDLRTGQGDFPPEAVAFGDGGILVSAPVPPGRRVFVVRYAVPSLDFTLPLPGTTDVMELLIREPAPALRVSRLEGAPPVELQPGSTYRIFSGEELRDAEVRVRPGEEEGGALPVEWVAVILALVLGVAGLAAVGVRSRRRDGEGAGGEAGGPAPPEEPTRQELVLEIARLDEAFEAKPDPGPEEEARYRARREALLERLASRE